MKDTAKITVGYQFRHMVLEHIIAVFVSVFVQLMAFGWMFDKEVLKNIAGVVFTLVYFLMIYGAAGNAAKYDKKSYTVLQPDKKKGFLMGLVLVAITLILFIGYKFVWAKLSVDGALQNWGAIAVNALFLVWTFPFFGLMGSAAGSITWYSTVIIFAVPVIASTLGYIAVCKNFDLLDKIVSFIYVKKDK